MGDDDSAAEGHRAAWGQDGDSTIPPPSRKRPAPVAEDDEELDDDVQRRLDALKGSAG